MTTILPLAAGIFQPIIIIFVVVVVVGGLSFSLYTILFPVKTAADRLDTLTAAASGEEVIDITGSGKQTPLEQIAARIGALAAARDDEMNEETRKLRDQLVYAGYKSRQAVDVLMGVRVGGALIIPVLLSPLGFTMTPQGALFAMVLGAAFGYYFPLVYLSNRVESRQTNLLASFPDALDLLVSCVESGLGLDQAFRRVAVEMEKVAPPLAREFTLVTSEITAGVERMVALEHLHKRTGLEEIKSLVNMLAQSERFGSSISDSLRLYSQVARERRKARAEELAGQVGSKLTIVMIIFFLPVLMMILLAPTGIKIIFGDAE